MLRKSVVIGLLLGLLPLSAALAQEIPPGQNIGVQAERFKKDTERILEGEKELKPAQVEEAKPEEKAQAPTVTFLLKKVTVTGSTVFTAEELRLSYAPFLFKEVTFADLQTIARNIENEYKKKGYYTTKAYLPEQDIKDGEVRIAISEGKMGKLKIEGDRYVKKGVLEKYFHTQEGELLNLGELQKDILRLNRMSADLDLKAVIAAGEGEGTSDITLKVSDACPWHAGLGVDNRGTRLTGKIRENFYLRSTNLSGNLDNFFLISSFSSGTFGESASYLVPIDTFGTRLGIDVTYFNVKLGKDYKAADITGTSQIFTPHITKELALSDRFQADLDAGMDIKSILQKTGLDRTADDQLRIPYLGFSFVRLDASGQTTFSPRFDFGLEDIFGASERNHSSAGRAGTGGSFFKYEQAFRRIQRMPFHSYVLLRSEMQAASFTLPSSEQIQLGGADSVRGYPEGEYLADAGGFVDADWIFRTGFFVEPVVFADCGAGKLKKTNTGEQNNKFLAGTGAGLRFRFKDNVFVRLEWAANIGERPDSGEHSAFHFSFQGEM